MNRVLLKKLWSFPLKKHCQTWPLLIVLTLFCFYACETAAPPAEEESTPTESTTEAPPAINQLTEAEKAAGWTLLFDGQSTDQWRSYNGENFPSVGWMIDGEGNLSIGNVSGDMAGGDIITKSQYENYEFQLDFMVSDTGNSGIFYRVSENEDQPIWFNAPEYQILDDSTYIAMGEVTDKQLTAANYDLHVCSGGKALPAGSWNTARIVINGQQVEHWLNGQQTVAYEIGSADWNDRYKASKFKDYPNYGQTTKGHIGLQDHGRPIKFRNIKIRML
ncbi:MAG: DUF1080 domain-containing protein [Bacteroidota bacterium]